MPSTIFWAPRSGDKAFREYLGEETVAMLMEILATPTTASPASKGPRKRVAAAVQAAASQPEAKAAKVAGGRTGSLGAQSSRGSKKK